MISVKMPDNVQRTEFLELLDGLLAHQIESVEIDVHKNNDQQPVIFISYILKNGDEAQKEMLLDRLFEWIKTEAIEIEWVLNLVETNLEAKVNRLVKDYGLSKQVRFTGKVDPTYYSLWDRLLIYYDVENCLPTFYHFAEIKQHHIDVIHYFLDRYKLRTLRLSVQGLTENFIHWAKREQIALSIYDVPTIKEAEELCDMGVEYVTISPVSVKASIK